VTTTSTRRLRLFLVVGVLAVALGLGTGRPELVAIGSPFLVLVGVGAVTEPEPGLAVSAALNRRRALEGERVTLELAVGAARPIRRIDVLIPLPDGVELIDAGLDGEPAVIDDGVVVTSLPAGSSRIEIGLHCVHWGTYRFDRVEVRSRSLTGTHARSIRADGVLQLKVFPAVAVLRRLLEPIETRLGFGDLVSRARGAGFEYADLRVHVPGDDPRSINWRVTARAGEPWITERHPERSADVVFMLDTFAEARRGVDQTLDLAVRAVTSLTEAHGRRLDRVGLLAFGEPVRWLQPGMGDRHRYRVLDTLMESRLVWQQYWRGLGAVPRRSLPADALIIALSPLLDDRAVRALADVRGRGFDLAIIELELHDYLPAPRNDTDAIARRIWSLERDHIRHRFERQGVVVTPWSVGDPFPNAILQADSFRRRLLRARA
jgi:uncharacterized protein (DUF58 family)